MKSGYILLTQLLMDMQRMRGRVLQIEGRLGSDKPGVARSAMTELGVVREELQRYADVLVEVQVMFPEPTKGDIVRHFDPSAKDVPMVTVDPADLMGMIGTTPGPGKSMSTAEAIMTIADATLAEVFDEDGAVNDGRPAGWTEALALEFIADGSRGLDIDSFANLFLHGDWPTIQKEWPEFQTFINKQLEGSGGHQ